MYWCRASSSLTSSVSVPEPSSVSVSGSFPAGVGARPALLYAGPSDGVRTLDEHIQRRHETFLDECLLLSFLTNSDLLRTIQKLLMVCVTFSNHMKVLY